MKYDIELDGRKHRLIMERTAGSEQWTFHLDGAPCAADACFLEPDILSILIEGRSVRVLLDPRPESTAIAIGERRIPYRIDDPRSLNGRGGAKANDSGARPITASMPGRIIRILVEPGHAVEAGQGLIVVEAMKMQNELKAPKAGTIQSIGVEVGATVQAGKVLMVLE